MSKYGVFSGPYFLVFGLNKEIYSVNLCIQSEYRRILLLFSKKESKKIVPICCLALLRELSSKYVNEFEIFTKYFSLRLAFLFISIRREIK